MNGLWLEDQILTYRENLPLPEPEPGEALIKVRLGGVCSTDLELVKGYYPFTGIPGHEFVGEVVRVSDGKPEDQAWIGKRVVGEINAACGCCNACLRGNSTHCERRTVLGISGRNGVFASYLVLPLENLHLVPETVQDEAAVFCEPLAAALEIQQQVHIRPADRVLIIGAGRLGQLCAQTLALTGCELRVVARHPYQRELLQSRSIISIREDEVITGRTDIVVEATGNPQGFYLAQKAVRPRGTIVMKSTYQGDTRLNLSALVVAEVTLVGSRCGPFPPALSLLDSQRVDPLPLIQARYPLSEGIEAFEHASRPGVLKVLIIPG
ncbi:MAG: MDR/zinc-dependent alcohol dehydrogenase-like family protein [Omnitrophica WOR_2 bacterium]